jgi:hypothetical protein
MYLFPVISAEAGIQYFHAVKNSLDPGFHRGDDGKAIFSQVQGGPEGILDYPIA